MMLFLLPFITAWLQLSVQRTSYSLLLADSCCFFGISAKYIEMGAVFFDQRSLKGRLCPLLSKEHLLLEGSGVFMCNSPIRFASVPAYRFSRSGCSASQVVEMRTTGTLLSINNRVKIKKRFTGAYITQKAPAFGEEEQQTIPRRVRLL
jgi:hypothetical protein